MLIVLIVPTGSNEPVLYPQPFSFPHLKIQRAFFGHISQTAGLHLVLVHHKELKLLIWGTAASLRKQCSLPARYTMLAHLESSLIWKQTLRLFHARAIAGPHPSAKEACASSLLCQEAQKFVEPQVGQQQCLSISLTGRGLFFASTIPIHPKHV